MTTGTRAETPLYFARDGRQLFGVLHEPRNMPPMAPFVFCHPFGEEKLWTQRVYVSFARMLANEGHVVFRFDYLGNGDSDGDFSESSLSTALADVRAALDHVRRVTGHRSINLLGLRLGATVASLAAESDAGIGQLVLWAPIVDGARYMQDLLRINLTTQMATYKVIRQDRVEMVETMQRGGIVNIEGYEMAFPFYSEVTDVKLADGLKKHAGPCLVVQIEPRAGRVSEELQRLTASYEHAQLVAAQEEPFWKEIQRFYGEAPNLFGATLQWLRAQGAAARS